MPENKPTASEPLDALNDVSGASEVTDEPPKAKRAFPASLMSGRTVLFGLVIALVGYFAWSAVTDFISIGFRAKIAEGPNHLAGLRKAEFAYHAQHGEFQSAGSCPMGAPGRKAVAWEGDCTAPFSTLGWAPDGPVRCQYTAVAIPGENEKADFKLTARCDADGDGVESVFEASRYSPVKRITPNNIY